MLWKQRSVLFAQNFVEREVDWQSGNYVRGKFLEICIVWAASYLAFTLLGLQFAMLLGFMVGVSVILPFIGAALATLPVALVALFQWGWGGDFVWGMAVYGIIQLLDGNVLSPVLFSEAVGLHPVALTNHTNPNCATCLNTMMGLTLELC